MLLWIDEQSLSSGDLRRRGWSFNLQKVLWLAFTRFRAWVFMYGVVPVTYREGSKRG